MDKRNNPKYIREFLVKNDLDVNLLERILEDIVDSEQLCSQDKPVVYYLQLSNDKSKEIEFWKINIEKYIHLYIYTMLLEWEEESEGDEKIRQRCESFRKNFANQIQKEIDCFVENIDKIPHNIHTKMGPIMDSFLFKEKFETPYLYHLYALSNKGDVLTEKFICQYQNTIKKVINQDCFVNKIDVLLNTCLILDTFIGNKSNVIELLKYGCITKSDKLKDILISYPYYGDDFGLNLLYFFEENKDLYCITNEVISRYKAQFYYDSWLRTINDSLGDSSRPYSVQLCEETPFHKEIVKCLNSAHLLLWNKCNNACFDVIKEVKQENPDFKREPVSNKLIERVKTLCQDETNIIYSRIKPLIKDAIKDGVKRFINTVRNQAIANGKKIELSEEVSSAIYELLLEKYTNFELPDLSKLLTIKYKLFGEKVAYVWVRRWLIGNDDISNIEDISKERFSEIKHNFDINIWEPIQNVYINWCKCCYSYMIPEKENKSETNSSSYHDYSSDSSDDVGLPYYVINDWPY